MWCSHEEFVEHRDPNKKRSLFSATVGKIKRDKKHSVCSDWTSRRGVQRSELRRKNSTWRQKRNGGKGEGKKRPEE